MTVYLFYIRRKVYHPSY